MLYLLAATFVVGLEFFLTVWTQIRIDVGPDLYPNSSVLLCYPWNNFTNKLILKISAGDTKKHANMYTYTERSSKTAVTVTISKLFAQISKCGCSLLIQQYSLIIRGSRNFRHVQNPRL